jgi:hypothetical protein
MDMATKTTLERAMFTIDGVLLFLVNASAINSTTPPQKGKTIPRPPLYK